MSVQEFDSFVQEILPLFRKYIGQAADPTVPVIKPIGRDELLARFRHSLGGALPEKGQSLSRLKSEMQLVLDYTQRTSKAKFLGKLHSGTDAVSQFASLLLAVVNTNVHTFDASPSLTVCEKIVVDEVCALFYGAHHADTRGGVVVPGGSYANFLAVRNARDSAFPRCAEHGYDFAADGIPVMLTSDQSHYSVESAGVTLGIGRRNVVKIKTHLDATIDVADLKKVLSELSTKSMPR